MNGIIVTTLAGLMTLVTLVTLVTSCQAAAMSYPTLNRYEDLFMNVSTSYFLSVDNTRVYFTSPVNNIYPTLPIDNPKDAVYRVTNLKNALQGLEPPNTSLVTADIVFPNALFSVPSSIASQLGFRGDSLLLTTGRFPLAGLGAAGEIVFLDGETGEQVLITEVADENDPWYYSKVVFYDVDKDGDLDILAIRNQETGRLIPPARFPFWGQLLWFEQPSTGPRGKWIEHILVNPIEVTNDGPDGGSLAWGDLDNDGVPELAVAEFWSYKLTLYWPSNGDWSDAASIVHTDIAPQNSLGNVYDVVFADVNNDGKLDILATNHINEAEPEPRLVEPSLYLFLVANDFKTNPSNAFTKIVIDDTLARYYKPDVLSPGYVTAFSPSTASNDSKPLLALGGDGTGEWYIYTPVSQDSNNHVYTREIMDACQGDQIKPFYFPSLKNLDDPASSEGIETLFCGCLGYGKLSGGFYP